MPSVPKSSVAKAISLVGVAFALVLAVRARASVTSANEAHGAQLQAFGDALDARALAMESLSAKYVALAKREQVALGRLSELDDADGDSAAGCADAPPTYKYGVGILQVAGVLSNRGDDTAKFAANQVTRLRTLFGSKSVQTWPGHLSQYLGRGSDPIRRVVLNDVDPEAGAAMCAWLRCQKWTGGCVFITETGESTPTENTPEYAPTEDLYDQWVSSVEHQAPRRL